MFLIFDTETTGFPKDWNAPITDLDNWPRVVQLAWQIHDEEGELVEVQDHIIYPDGFDIPFNATKIHGISTERARMKASRLKKFSRFRGGSMEKCEYLIGHNVNFDLNVTGCEYYRVKERTHWMPKILGFLYGDYGRTMPVAWWTRGYDTSFQNSRSCISTCSMKVLQKRTMRHLTSRRRPVFS